MISKHEHISYLLYITVLLPWLLVCHQLAHQHFWCHPAISWLGYSPRWIGNMQTLRMHRSLRKPLDSPGSIPIFSGLCFDGQITHPRFYHEKNVGKLNLTFSWWYHQKTAFGKIIFDHICFEFVWDNRICFIYTFNLAQKKTKTHKLTWFNHRLIID